MFDVSKKRIIRAMLVLVGIIICLYIYSWYRQIYWENHIPDDVLIGKPIYSPSNKFKAIVFTENGGGGISPYCFDIVSVVPVSTETANSFKKMFHVYEGGCHSLRITSQNEAPPILENAPLVKWKSDSELEIEFDKKSAMIGINKFSFVSQADDGRIKIVQRQHETWP